MKTEQKLQATIIKYLKSKGCYVIKHNAAPGVPVGCPDISFYIEGFFGFAEIKTNSKSPFRPLQKETIAKLNEWSWAKVISNDNWEEIKQELETIL